MRPRIILVTDPAFGDDHVLRCVREIGGALPDSALCVQLRDKRRPVTSLRLFAGQLRKATRDAGASLVINGNATVARDVGADGVHLGGGAGTVEAARAVLARVAWISVAAHSDDDVAQASKSGADAVLVSAIFPTRPPWLRDDEAAKLPRGTGALRAARDVAGPGVTVIALGGVTLDNARACAAAGADGVAVIRALLASPRPAAAARALFDAMTRRP